MNKKIVFLYILIICYVMFLSGCFGFYKYENILKKNPNDSHSWYNLGVCYEEGKGTKKDAVLAFECYQKAVKNAEIKKFSKDVNQAYYKLGLCYMEGKGTEVDYNKAYENFEKLIIQFKIDSENEIYSDALFKLGICNIARKISKEEYEKLYSQLDGLLGYKDLLSSFNEYIPYIVYFVQKESLEKFVSDSDYGKTQKYFIKAYNYGNINAILYLQFFYNYFTDESFEQFILEHSSNSLEFWYLSNFYQRSDFRIDQMKAFDYLKKSIRKDRKMPMAWYNLGYCYEEGIGTEIDKEKSMDCYRKANKIDNTDFTYINIKNFISKIFLFTKTDTKKELIYSKNDTVDEYLYELGCNHRDAARAFEYYSTAAELEETNSKYWKKLGFCYEEGLGVEINKLKSEECYQKANELDGSVAEYFYDIAKDYENKGSKTKAFEYYNKAITEDDTVALYWNQLGLCYDNGMGTEVDGNKAFECYKNANELDNSIAAYWYNLGTCYDYGKGTEIDKNVAFNCYNNAKVLNPYDDLYWYKVGICYEYGIGTDFDEKQAFEHYLKANELSKTNVLYLNKLGDCYKHGVGIKKSRKQAKIYYKQAKQLENM